MSFDRTACQILLQKIICDIDMSDEHANDEIMTIRNKSEMENFFAPKFTGIFSGI